MNAMFTLLPMTFVLPKEFLAFADAFGKAGAGAIHATVCVEGIMAAQFEVLRIVWRRQKRWRCVMSPLE